MKATSLALDAGRATRLHHDYGVQLRLASVLFVAFACAASVYSEWTRISYAGLDYGMFLFGLTWPLYAAWITDPEGLPARLAASLPRSRMRRLLLAPCLPGGGRTALLFTLQLLALYGACLIGRGLAALSGQTLWGWEGWVKTGMVASYLATWLLLTTVLFSRWTARAHVRAFALLSIPALAISLPFLLSGLGSWVPSYTGQIFDHYGHTRRDGFVPVVYRPAYYTMFGLALLAITLNLPRMVRGVREVLDAPQ